MAIWVVKFPSEGLARFLTKNQRTRRKLCTVIMLSCQTLGIILENKAFQKLKLPKTFNNKKCASRIDIFNKKNFES